MKAAILRRPNRVEENPLFLEEVPLPAIGRRQVLVKAAACGVCWSNLHIIEADWVEMDVPAKSPIIPVMRLFAGWRE